MKGVFYGPLKTNVQGNLIDKIMDHKVIEDHVMNNDKKKDQEDSVMKNVMTNELEFSLKDDNKHASEDVTYSVMNNAKTNEL